MTLIRLSPALIFLCFSLISFGKPLKFHGLDWSMSHQEMFETLKDKGYTCAAPAKNDFRFGSPTWLCQKNSIASISIYDQSHIAFGCEAYKGCDHTYDELVTAISEKYGINAEYLMDDRFEDNHIFLIKWEGEDGDWIEISKFANSKSNPETVTLYKGGSRQRLDF